MKKQYIYICIILIIIAIAIYYGFIKKDEKPLNIPTGSIGTGDGCVGCGTTGTATTPPVTTNTIVTLSNSTFWKSGDDAYISKDIYVYKIVGSKIVFDKTLRFLDYESNLFGNAKIGTFTGFITNLLDGNKKYLGIFVAETYYFALSTDVKNSFGITSSI